MEEKNESSMPKNNYSMLADNGILYRAPSQLSSCVARTYKIEYAQRGEYSGSAPVIFDLNTGTSFVDPQTAVLSFDLEINNTGGNAANVYWGGGLGGCSLFDEIRIISKNGVELDRTQDAGLLAKILSDWTMSAESRTNAEMCDGYSTLAGDPYGFTIPALGYLIRPISIPMKFLSGFFRPTVKGMLLNAGLASGLRIELSLANASRSFVTDTPECTDGEITFKLKDCQLLLQLSDMNDPVQSALFTQSARSGLEYNFPSFFSSKVTNGGSDKINEQVKKSVSQANKAFAVILNKTDQNYESIKFSGFKSKPADATASYNWRLGSQYYPLEKLSKVPNFWAIANSAFDGLRNVEWKPNQVTYINFYDNGMALMAASLDMSDRINLSGSKINNSSVLELRLGLSSTAQVDVVLFLQFTAEVRTSGSRSVLKI